MKYGVRIKLNLNMIDKAKLFAGKNGKYLDATVFLDVDTKDQYENNGMITQDAPKSEKGAILGNAQVFWNDGGQQQYSQQQQAPQQQGQSAPMAEPSFDDDLPF